jgi:hypothetical protein
MTALDEMLRRTGLHSADDSPNTIFNAVANLARRLTQPESVEGAVTLTPQGLPIISGRVEFGTGTVVADAEKFIPHDEVLDLLERVLDEAGIDIWLAFDRLDEAFQGHPAVEDATQEAMVRAYVRWHRVSKLERPDLWVIRVAANIAIGAWRRRRHEVGLSDSTPSLEPGDEIRVLWLRWAMERLTPEDRLLLILRHRVRHGSCLPSSRNPSPRRARPREAVPMKCLPVLPHAYARAGVDEDVPQIAGCRPPSRYGRHQGLSVTVAKRPW